jgi:hypothetical protein
MEKDAFLFVIHDPILHYVKTFEERNSWAIPPNFNNSGKTHQFTFAFPPIGLRINVTKPNIFKSKF